MTPPLLQPLFNAIIGAQVFSDPLVRDEAARRFLELDSRIIALPTRERWRIEHDLYAMLPSDWPLWLENYYDRPAVAVH